MVGIIRIVCSIAMLTRCTARESLTVLAQNAFGFQMTVRRFAVGKRGVACSRTVQMVRWNWLGTA